MPSLIFFKVNDACGEPEARINRYVDGLELPPGQWSVTYEDDGRSEVMLQEEMPYHWQEQIAAANRWAERAL